MGAGDGRQTDERDRITLPGGWYFEQLNENGQLFSLRTPKGKKFGIRGSGMSTYRATAEEFAKSIRDALSREADKDAELARLKAEINRSGLQIATLTNQRNAAVSRSKDAVARTKRAEALGQRGGQVTEAMVEAGRSAIARETRCIHHCEPDASGCGCRKQSRAVLTSLAASPAAQPDPADAKVADAVREERERCAKIVKRVMNVNRELIATATETWKIVYREGANDLEEILEFIRGGRKQGEAS